MKVNTFSNIPYLKFWMGNMRLLEPQRHGPDKPLELGRLPSEVLPDEGHFGHHPLPAFPPGLPGLEDLEDIGLGDRLDGWKGDLVPTSLLLTFLLHHTGDILSLQYKVVETRVEYTRVE